MNSFSYIGQELEIFREAVNWKRYFSSEIKKYIGSDVLEVGAGIGETTQFLCHNQVKRWVCLEPDKELGQLIQQKVSDGMLPRYCELEVGTLNQFDDTRLFDTIVYVDVLEHIENDHLELTQAAKHLQDNGHVIILAPAFQWLSSPFDSTIGHFRRYTRTRLRQICPEGMAIADFRYLDSVGLLCSLVNKLILKQKLPTNKQILFWDKILVPLSKLFDRIFFHRFGKSLICIIKKNNYTINYNKRVNQAT